MTKTVIQVLIDSMRQPDCSIIGMACIRFLRIMFCHVLIVSSLNIRFIQIIYMTSLPAPAPNIRWHLNLHEALRTTTDGTKYILCMIDSTSMWPELIATEECIAEKVGS